MVRKAGLMWRPGVQVTLVRDLFVALRFPLVFQLTFDIAAMRLGRFWL